MKPIEINFQHTLKSLRPPTIAALISFAEDGSTIFPLFEYPKIMECLEARSILKWNIEAWDRAFGVGMQANVPQIVFTDYGKAFVEWLRQPKNAPGQLALFGDES